MGGCVWVSVYGRVCMGECIWEGVYRCDGVCGVGLFTHC